MSTENSIEVLIHDLNDDGQIFSKRLILTVKNEDAQMMNTKAYNLKPGDSKNSFSVDFVIEEEAGAYPNEVFNTFQRLGLPSHDL
jgi:hypothetical protein